MAKLILYSNQLVEEDNQIDIELVKLIDKKNPSIAYIPSCSDLSRKYFDYARAFYRGLGIDDLQYFDLDLEFDEARIMDIFKADAIHLSGGNSFYFLHLLRKRGLLEHLKTYVQSGGVLIGISAGSILMTKTIEIAGYGEECDVNDIGIKEFDALGLVDFEFMPHWDGTEEFLDSVRSYATNKNTVVYVCKDGDGIVVDGDNVKLIGNVITIQ